MSDLTYQQQLLKRTAAKIAYDVGFHSAQPSTIDTLAEVLRTYMIQLCVVAKEFSEHADKNVPDLSDLDSACKFLGIDFGQLKDYILNVDSSPLDPPVPFFPIKSRPNRTADYRDDAIDDDQEDPEEEFEPPDWFEDWMPTLNVRKHCRIVAEKIRVHELELEQLKAKEEINVEEEVKDGPNKDETKATEETEPKESEQPKEDEKLPDTSNNNDVLMDDLNEDPKMSIDDDDEIDEKKDDDDATKASKLVFRFPTSSALEEAELAKKNENDSSPNDESNNIDRKAMIEKFMSSKTFQQFKSALTDKSAAEEKVKGPDSCRLENNYISREATPEPVEEKPADDAAQTGKKPRKKKRDLFGEFANQKQPRRGPGAKKKSPLDSVGQPNVLTNTIGNTFGLKFNLNLGARPEPQPAPSTLASPFASLKLESNNSNPPLSFGSSFLANSTASTSVANTPVIPSFSSLTPTPGTSGISPEDGQPRQKRKYTKRAQTTPKPPKPPKVPKRKANELAMNRTFDDISATGMSSLDGVGSSNLGEDDASKHSENMYIDPAVLAADDSFSSSGASKAKKPRKTKTPKISATPFAGIAELKPETKKGRPKAVSNKIKSQEVVESSDESSDGDDGPEGEEFDSLRKKALLANYGLDSEISSQDVHEHEDSSKHDRNETFQSPVRTEKEPEEERPTKPEKERKRKTSVSSIEEGEAVSDYEDKSKKSVPIIKPEKQEERQHDDESVAESSRSKEEKRKEKHKKKKKDKDKNRDEKEKHRKHKKNKKEKHRDKEEKKEFKLNIKIPEEQRDSPISESNREDSLHGISSDHERKKSKEKKKDKKDKEKRQRHEHSSTPEPSSFKFIREEKPKKSSLGSDEKSIKNKKLLISLDPGSDGDSHPSGTPKEKSKDKSDKHHHTEKHHSEADKLVEKTVPKLKMKDVIHYDSSEKKKNKDRPSFPPDDSIGVLFKPDTKEKKKKEKQQSTIKIDALPPIDMSPPRLTSAEKASKKSDQEKSCTIIRETISTKDETVYLCPACKLPDDGSPMIGCDECEEWYHYICVNIIEAPPDNWFCPACTMKDSKKSKKKSNKSESSTKKSSKNSVTITPLPVFPANLGHEVSIFPVNLEPSSSRSHIPDVTITPHFKVSSTKKSKKKSKKVNPGETDTSTCPICAKDVKAGLMVSCERCEQCYHLDCIGMHDNNPLDWLCEHCSRVEQFLNPNKPLSKTDQKFLAAQANSKKKSSLETSSQEDARCGVCNIGGEEDEGRNWVACDECSTWYHYECEGIIEDPPEDEKWICKKCIKKHKHPTKSLKKLM